MSRTSNRVLEPAGAQQNHAVPAIFCKDRLPLQFVCLLGLALSFSGKVSVSDYLSNFTYPSVEPPVINSPLPTWLNCLLLTFLLVLAIWEATRFPRLASQATTTETLRTMLQAAGDFILTPWRAMSPGEVPMLGYQRTPANLQILARCPALSSFKQAAWLHNALLAFFVLMWHDNVGTDRFRKNVRRELVHAPDGGVVALDWWEEEQKPLVKAKRVLFIASTLTGDAVVTTIRDICQHFTSRGWRCVVMVKRGCGLTIKNTQPCVGHPDLKASAPWCLSGLPDIELAINHVVKACPGLPVCGVGLSCGAGQLRNYVNRLGPAAKLSAAVIVDAAPAWEPALDSLDKRLPMLGVALAAAMRTTYERCGSYPTEEAHREGSEEPPPGAVLKFVWDQMAPAHGFRRTLAGASEYLQSCQPAHATDCAVPVLEMVTFNDTLITAEMCQRVQQFWEASPHVVTAATRQGTHMIRWEGFLRLRCWLSVAAAEFLEAALQQPPQS